MEYESGNDINYYWCARYGHQRFDKETGGLGNKWTSGNHRNYNIILLILFTHPSARAGYDTRSVFKRSLTGLNSQFSFS